MSTISFNIKGAAEMERLLRDLGPRVASRLGDKALRAGAKPIVTEAKRLVPVRTGELKRSITTRIDKNKKAGERAILLGFRRPTSRRAHLTEFGTRHSPASKFMTRALDTRTSQALMEMARVMAEGIETEALKR